MNKEITILQKAEALSLVESINKKIAELQRKFPKMTITKESSQNEILLYLESDDTHLFIDIWLKPLKNALQNNLNSQIEKATSNGKNEMTPEAAQKISASYAIGHLRDMDDMLTNALKQENVGAAFFELREYRIKHEAEVESSIGKSTGRRTQWIKDLVSPGSSRPNSSVAEHNNTPLSSQKVGMKNTPPSQVDTPSQGTRHLRSKKSIPPKPEELVPKPPPQPIEKLQTNRVTEQTHPNPSLIIEHIEKKITALANKDFLLEPDELEPDEDEDSRSFMLVQHTFLLNFVDGQKNTLKKRLDVELDKVTQGQTKPLTDKAAHKISKGPTMRQLQALDKALEEALKQNTLSNSLAVFKLYSSNKRKANLLGKLRKLIQSGISAISSVLSQISEQVHPTKKPAAENNLLSNQGGQEKAPSSPADHAPPPAMNLAAEDNKERDNQDSREIMVPYEEDEVSTWSPEQIEDLFSKSLAELNEAYDAKQEINAEQEIDDSSLKQVWWNEEGDKMTQFDEFDKEFGIAKIENSPTTPKQDQSPARFSIFSLKTHDTQEKQNTSTISSDDSSNKPGH